MSHSYWERYWKRDFKGRMRNVRHFLLDSETEYGWDRVFKYAMETLHARTVSQKLDTVFMKLNFAAKLNAASGFVLKNVENRTFRYYFAHKKNTLKEQSNFLATNEVLVKFKFISNNTTVVEAYTKVGENTKSKFYKLTIVIGFEAIFIETPTEC